MPQYAAIIYSADVDWTQPEHAEETAGYMAFGEKNASILRGGAALYQTSTATTVRIDSARPGEIVTSDGPYAETKEALTGFYLIECADLDEAVRVAAELPAARNGAVEVRPVITFG